MTSMQGLSGAGRSPGVDDLREYLGLIRSEAFRCKTITNGLLDFSRTRPAAHAPVSLGDIISSAIRLLAHQQRANNINFQIETAKGKFHRGIS